MTTKISQAQFKEIAEAFKTMELFETSQIPGAIKYYDEARAKLFDLINALNCEGDLADAQKGSQNNRVREMNIAEAIHKIYYKFNGLVAFGKLTGMYVTYKENDTGAYKGKARKFGKPKHTSIQFKKTSKGWDMNFERIEATGKKIEIFKMPEAAKVEMMENLFNKHIEA